MNRTAVTVAALLAIGTMVWIGGQFASAAQPKTDSCRQYHEKALEYLKAVESDDAYGRIRYDVNAVRATMYSSYYLVCRDLERQR
jgi:hypothetical protein